MPATEVTIWNNASCNQLEFAANCLAEIKRAYAKGLSRADAAKVVAGEPCAFRVRVVVERVMPATTTNPITYLAGDATAPAGPGNKIIAHVCNDRGAWGAGFVLAVSARWPEPEDHYRREAAGDLLKLGDVQLVRVSDHACVANLVAQVLGDPTGVNLRYDVLRDCLSMLAGNALAENASVHMPRIGCGLAGGTWDRVEPVINETLVAAGVAVTVYDFAPQQS